ncbi:MAG: hypothetical protein LBU23_00805, partial [Planctomycetota bacterium]|nr:hypothetical protein [Planctomycetota bacterium]
MDGAAFSGIGVWRAVFRLRLPFSHHSAARDRVETLLVEVRAANGGVGHGQALPRAYLTGESLGSVSTAIRETYWPALKKTALPENPGPEAALAALRPLYRLADARRENAAWAAL